MGSVFDEYAKEITEEVTEKVTKETEQRDLLSHLRTIMETMHLTAEQAMDALRVPAEDRDNVKNRIAFP